MALDAVTNFAKAIVSTGYDDDDTEIVLDTDEGAKFPLPSEDGEFNVVWWNSTDYSDPADDPNAEIVRVTARSTDTLTVTRAQESTAATTKNTGGKTYKMILGITAKMITDIGVNFLAVTGATTGATSQAQTFTNGVNLSNLTSGRVPYATTDGLLTDDATFLFDSGTGTLSATYFSGDGTDIENVKTLTFQAKAGEALKEGQAVYINGGASALPTVFKADNTTLDKTRVVGLASADADENDAVLIRRYGVLINVDTQATNTDINPNAETWSEGDLLFATTGGGLTNVRPTSGRSVKAAYSLKGSSKDWQIKK